MKWLKWMRQLQLNMHCTLSIKQNDGENQSTALDPGFSIGGTNIEITITVSHLLYADDTFIFL